MTNLVLIWEWSFSWCSALSHVVSRSHQDPGQPDRHHRRTFWSRKSQLPFFKNQVLDTMVSSMAFNEYFCEFNFNLKFNFLEMDYHWLDDLSLLAYWLSYYLMYMYTLGARLYYNSSGGFGVIIIRDKWHNAWEPLKPEPLMAHATFLGMVGSHSRPSPSPGPGWEAIQGKRLTITNFFFAYIITRAREYPGSILAGWIRARICFTRAAPSSCPKKEEGTGSQSWSQCQTT